MMTSRYSIGLLSFVGLVVEQIQRASAINWGIYSDLEELRLVLRRATGYVQELPPSDVDDMQDLLQSISWSSGKNRLKLLPTERPGPWVQRAAKIASGGKSSPPSDLHDVSKSNDVTVTQHSNIKTASSDSVLGLFCPLLGRARVSRSFMYALEEYDIGMEGDLVKVLLGAEWMASSELMTDSKANNHFASAEEWRDILQETLKVKEDDSNKSTDESVSFWLLHPRHLPSLLFWFKAFLVYQAGHDMEREVDDTIEILGFAKHHGDNAQDVLLRFTEHLLGRRVCWGKDVQHGNEPEDKLIMLPVFRLLLGLTILGEARRNFFEPNEMAIIWSTSSSSWIRESITAEDFNRDSGIFRQKLTNIITPHYGKKRLVNVLEYYNDLWVMLLRHDIAERMDVEAVPTGVLARGIPPEDVDEALSDSLSTSSSSNLVYRSIATDRTSELMDDMHMSARLSSALRELQDDIFRLAFMVSRPSEKFMLVGTDVNMTSFGLLGVEHIVSFPGNILFPFSPLKEKRLGDAGKSSERGSSLAIIGEANENEDAVSQALTGSGFDGIGVEEEREKRLLRHRLDCGYGLVLGEGGDDDVEDVHELLPDIGGDGDDEEAAFFSEDGGGVASASVTTRKRASSSSSRNKSLAARSTSETRNKNAYFRDSSAILNDAFDLNYPNDQFTMRHETRRFLWKARQVYVQWHGKSLKLCTPFTNLPFRRSKLCTVIPRR